MEQSSKTLYVGLDVHKEAQSPLSARLVRPLDVALVASWTPAAPSCAQPIGGAGVVSRSGRV